MKRVKDISKPKGWDRIVVQDSSAPSMWARFYEIETNKPLFCSRDGAPKYQLSEISHERRTGYSWLGYYVDSLLKKEYPAWQKNAPVLMNRTAATANNLLKNGGFEMLDPTKRPTDRAMERPLSVSHDLKNVRILG